MVASVIWAAFGLIAGMILIGWCAWYLTRRWEAARLAGAELRFTRRISWFPVLVGVVILAVGLVASVDLGDWVVLIPVTCAGVLVVAPGAWNLYQLRRAADERSAVDR